MSKRTISSKNRPIRTVEFGAGYEIRYSPADNEYSAYLTATAIDAEHFIGIAGTKDDARDLVWDYAAYRAECRREAA